MGCSGRLARVAVAALVAVAGGLAAAATAPAAVTFGLPLNSQPNVSFGCEVNPSVAGPIPWIGATPPNCTWFSGGFAQPGSTASHLAPVSGVITRVRIRMGPRVGPMRFSILRMVRAPQSLKVACCFGQAVSQVFTPAPNAVTTVPVQLPVLNAVVTGVYTQDILAISPQSLQAALPLFDTGNHTSTLNNWGNSAFYPQVLPEAVRADGSGYFGYVLLMNADIEPDADGDGLGDESQDSSVGSPGSSSPPGTTPAPQPTPAPGPAPGPGSGTTPAPSPGTTPAPGATRPVALRTRTARVRNRRVPLALRCRLEATCRGVVRLQSRRASAARQTLSQRVTIRR